MAKKYTGIIVSLKTPKTAIVSVERTFKHPKYKKIIRKTKRLKAHYESEKLSLNDTVVIRETRPISKDKFFRVESIVKR